MRTATWSNQHFILVRAVIALGLVAGCQLTPTFNTGYRSDWMSSATVSGRLAVRRFDDQRPPRVYTQLDHMYLTSLPLVPYVTSPYERVDESVRLLSRQIETDGPGTPRIAEQHPAPDFEEYTYPASIARAVADDLRAAKVFSAVEYVGTTSLKGFRYVLSGTIRETPLWVTHTSYGLGAPGVLLWFTGLPMQKTTAVVALDLQLEDTERQEAIWRHELRGEVSRISVLYTSSEMSYGREISESFNIVPPPSDAQVDHHSLFGWHFEALRRAMQEARPGLAEAVSAHQ